jgi:hypothetical protein
MRAFCEAVRDGFLPETTYTGGKALGFRCAKDASTPPTPDSHLFPEPEKKDPY